MSQDKEMQFFKMTKVGDWYYLEVIESGGTLPDYTGYSVPSFPGDKNATLTRFSFSTIPSSNINTNCVFFGPNVDGGAQFEFFTPP